ncbi:MAG TPA: DUF6655 family protein [Alphaproteobacteria bacterium]|jgi:hypothetical protein|nr:DUF6655 family protein [Alphaproteobacteria bacterium]
MRVLTLIVFCLVLSACTTSRETNPQRTATEQLLLSTAVDHAVENIRLDIAPGAKVFVDSANFEGLDSRYAVGAIRDRILRLGGRIVSERAASDSVIEIRSGALSADQSKTLLGIPAFDVPIPLAKEVSIPDISLFKKSLRQGVAKLAATIYRTADGALIDSTGPQYGFSHSTDYVVLFLFSWSTDDLKPEEANQPLKVEGPDLGKIKLGNGNDSESPSP